MHSVALAIIAALGAITTAALYFWQRQCLTGLSYSRRLSEHRVDFGERITLELDLANDKLLPLPWCRIDDEVPAALTIEHAHVVSERAQVDTLVQLFPLLPYQRTRRRLTVVCAQRGLHTFGPARVTSGDPLGLRTRTGRFIAREQVLVFPKVVPVASTPLASRMAIGEQRTRFEFARDPTRVAGVRAYRAGDSLRDIDWRSTARTSTLLVREIESTVSLSVALCVDFQAQPAGRVQDSPELEYVVSVAASIAADIARRKLGLGLYGSGVVESLPLAFPPSNAPDAIGAILEGLARATSVGREQFARVLLATSGRLARGTSVVIVAADFPEATLLAIAELRRRYAVTAVHVATDRGAPPPPGFVDAYFEVRYGDDWEERELLELAG